MTTTFAKLKRLLLVSVGVGRVDVHIHQLAVRREDAAFAPDAAITSGLRWLLRPCRRVRGRVLRGSGVATGHGGERGDRAVVVSTGLCPLDCQGRQARHRARGQQDDRAGLQPGEEHDLENSSRE